MSDFYSPSQNRTARKPHRCTYCGEGIGQGDEYVFQKGNHDARWFESKMHPECFKDVCESGDVEYSPYCHDRPCAASIATIKDNT